MYICIFVLCILYLYFNIYAYHCWKAALQVFIQFKITFLLHIGIVTQEHKHPIESIGHGNGSRKKQLKQYKLEGADERGRRTRDKKQGEKEERRYCRREEGGEIRL